MGADFQRRGAPGPERFGYIPDRRHHAGFPVVGAARPLSTQTLPDVVNTIEPLARASGIYDQGAAPFCVSNALAAAIRDCEQLAGNAVPIDPSRLWIMYLAHALEDDTAGFDGAIIADAVEAVQKLGIPPETIWPYSDQNPGPFSVIPSQEAYRQASDQIKPLETARIVTEGDQRVDDLMRMLAFGGRNGKGVPVVFGTNVSNAYAANQLGPGFVADVPPDNDIDGGHAQKYIGYKRDPGAEGGVLFRVQNSWTDQWGDGGMCWHTVAYVKYAGTEDIHGIDYGRAVIA